MSIPRVKELLPYGPNLDAKQRWQRLRLSEILSGNSRCQQGEASCMVYTVPPGMETSSHPLFSLCQEHVSRWPQTLQDNDPKHNSKFIQISFFRMASTGRRVQPKAPTRVLLNEMGSMKTYLRDKYKPKSLLELKKASERIGAN